MTLNGRNVTFAEIEKFCGAQQKNFSKVRSTLSAAKCGTMILVRLHTELASKYGIQNYSFPTDVLFLTKNVLGPGSLKFCNGEKVTFAVLYRLPNVNLREVLDKLNSFYVNIYLHRVIKRTSQINLMYSILRIKVNTNSKRK